jgi:hypothetical protein
VRAGLQGVCRVVRRFLPTASPVLEPDWAGQLDTLQDAATVRRCLAAVEAQSAALSERRAAAARRKHAASEQVRSAVQLQCSQCRLVAHRQYQASGSRVSTSTNGWPAAEQMTCVCCCTSTCFDCTNVALVVLVFCSIHRVQQHACEIAGLLDRRWRQPARPQPPARQRAPRCKSPAPAQSPRQFPWHCHSPHRPQPQRWRARRRRARRRQAAASCFPLPSRRQPAAGSGCAATPLRPLPPPAQPWPVPRTLPQRQRRGAWRRRCRQWTPPSSACGKQRMQEAAASCRRLPSRRPPPAASRCVPLGCLMAVVLYQTNQTDACCVRQTGFVADRCVCLITCVLLHLIAGSCGCCIDMHAQGYVCTCRSTA